MVGITKRQGDKFARYADWYRIERKVKRCINEGSDRFAVELGGFEVRFDATKGADND